MKCDRCDKPATVHELTQVNGVKIERHLCEQCARELGLAPAGTPVGPMLGVKVTVASARANGCPKCQTSFADFKQHGLLGCSECYRVFESQLSPLLARAHQGGDRHRGKVPKRLSGAADTDDGLVAELAERARRLAALRHELDGAVKSEQYERAARLRDELKKLSNQARRKQARADEKGTGE